MYDLQHKKIDAQSEKVLLEIQQPFSNHNGGHIQFAKDQTLYFGLGDGGHRGDPHNHGQNPNTFLGSILRLNIDVPLDHAKGFTVPKDNPMIQGKVSLVFAYGLRNPWQFSFDPKKGRLWAADVGQNKWEEVHLIKKGQNHGWNAFEGFQCFKKKKCPKTKSIKPLLAYGRNLGVSITGGFVYHGDQIPQLQNHYLFADYGSGRFWAYSTKQKSVCALMKKNVHPASIVPNEKGEPLVVDVQQGRIFQLYMEPL